MARPRVPLAKAAVEGSDKKNPQRFRDRKEPKVDGPLGAPPHWIRDAEDCKAKSAWRVFERELPWLNSSHRLIVGAACLIQGRIMAGEPVGVTAIAQLRQLLGQMGATPADASKITLSQGDEEEDDGLD